MLLACQRMELPTWAFRGSHARTPTVGTPGTLYEVLADAAVVQQFTGAAPCLGLTVDSDQADDYSDIARHAAELGLAISSVYSDFPAEEGGLPALCHPEPWARRRGAERLERGVELLSEVDARRLVVRVVDGGGYPGRAEFLARRGRLREALASAAESLPPAAQLLLEIVRVRPYPCGGLADAPDWMVSWEHAQVVGCQAQVLVSPASLAASAYPASSTDQADNLDSPMGRLHRDDRLGGIVLPSPAVSHPSEQSWDRFGLFLLCAEAAQVGALGGGQLLTIDPRPVTHAGVTSLMHSLLAAQEMLLKAQSIDFSALHREMLDDPSPANEARVTELLLAAFDLDVTPQLEQLRSDAGIAPDPIAEYHQTCTARYVALERRAALQRAAERRLVARRADRRNRGGFTSPISHLSESAAG